MIRQIGCRRFEELPLRHPVQLAQRRGYQHHRSTGDIKVARAADIGSDAHATRGGRLEQRHAAALDERGKQKHVSPPSVDCLNFTSNWAPVWSQSS